MVKMNVILLLLWILSTEGAFNTNYVIPNPEAACPNKQCETLESYASNVSKYFRDNTSFVFLPGIHVLSTISVHHVSNVVLMASAELDEGNVTIQCNGSGGLVFQHVSNVVLANLAFVSCGQPLPLSLQREGETAQAALAFGEVTDLVLESVSVSDSRGFGVLGHCVYGKFNITNSNFISNKGSAYYLGGNGAIEYTNCSSTAVASTVMVTSSAFRYGDYEGYDYTKHAYSATYATGLMLIIAKSEITVTIANVSMEHNTNNCNNGYGGNLFLHAHNYTANAANNVSITDSTFVNGTAWLGAGIGVSFLSSNDSCKYTRLKFRLYNSQVSRNTALIGSGLYYEYQLEDMENPCSISPNADLKVQNSVLDGNAIKIETTSPIHFYGNGAAVHLLAKYRANRVVEKIHNSYTSDFVNCIFNNSHLIMGHTLRRTNTKLAVTAMTVRSINMDSSLTNCAVTDNAFPGVGLSNSKITARGDILIRNNTGVNGGGMLLCESSYLILSRNTTLSFIDNHAVQLGGGIYIQSECLHAKPFCFYQPDYRDPWNCANISDSMKIIMLNNTADYAGDHIYGGALDNCKISDCNSTDVFSSLFAIIPRTSKAHLSAVSSMPTRICFCTAERIPDCKNTTKEIKAQYPGEFVTLDIVAVGQFNGTVPATVHHHIQNSDIKPEVVSTSTNCTTLSMKVLTNETKHIKIDLQLASSLYYSFANDATLLSISDPLTVTVPLQTCPLGFIHRHGICDCTGQLKAERCDIHTNTITRKPPAWIGLYNTSDTPALIYHKVCPNDYCLAQTVNITSNCTLFDQDAQCSPNHEGLLCSKCKDGYTLSFGTSDCIKCSNKVALPVMTAVYLFCGAMLVLILIVFDTYTDGTFCGLLFYANVISLHEFIYIPRDQVNAVVRVLLSWMSLNLGLPFCFYEGMDSYGKSWLNFCFPVYLFIIAGVLIALVRKSKRMAKVLRGSTVKVLATVFILSYTILIQSVATVLSATVIQYPSSNTTYDKIVWSPDPTVEYFSGKHIPLALVAIVFGVLILAFTMVLLCVQPLQRYSHLRCFTWMAKLKPFIDAYTAPHAIKDHCRYWEGLLLFCRLLLAIIMESNVKSTANISLGVIFCICVLLLTIAWCAGGIYKKTHLNVINSSYILNLTVLTVALMCHGASYNFIISRNILYCSYSVAIGTMCIVVAYHGYQRVKRWYRLYRKTWYQELSADDDIDVDQLHNMRATWDRSSDMQDF